MTKRKHPISLTSEEEVFVSRIEDIAEQADRMSKVRFSSFLDIREQELALYAVRCVGNVSGELIGGYENALRKVIKISPSYLGDDFELPYELLVIDYPKKSSLQHKDFLGSLMGLGIKREVLGDISLNDGKAYLWCLKSISNTIIRELVTVGRQSVSVSVGDIENADFSAATKDFSDTVSSLRLDCIVSSLINASREQSAKLIRSAQVLVNGREITETSKQIEQGSILSIRRHGKFILEEIGDTNKKGRIRIYCKKYC